MLNTYPGVEIVNPETVWFHDYILIVSIYVQNNCHKWQQWLNVFFFFLYNCLIYHQ